MKPEAQRIAIAEACGYTLIYKGWPCDTLYGEHLGGDPMIPDYLNDLNAMREAVFFALEGPEQSDTRHLYRQELEGICGTKNDAIDATAAQRAEAFLKTLNLWTDETPAQS